MSKEQEPLMKKAEVACFLNVSQDTVEPGTVRRTLCAARWAIGPI